jgi:hypothetical protein
MTTATLDAPLLDRTDDALARPLPAALVGARRDVLTAAAHLASIPEDALPRPWGWIGGSEYEVRYGVYRAAEGLEEAETAARRLLAADDPGETAAAWIVGPATAARWDLHGLLLPLPEATLDADPGGGEWTLRLVMGHVISSQRGYNWGTAWWLANPHEAGDPNLPQSAPDSYWAALPDEATTEAEGSSADLRARLDAQLDLGMERLAGLPDDRLGVAARWAGFEVTVGFRLARWGSHIREHTIQLEKTLAMLGDVPDEPRRLTRHLLAAYGRAEAAAFGRRPGSATDAAIERIARSAAEARDSIASAAEAARVGT